MSGAFGRAGWSMWMLRPVLRHREWPEIKWILVVVMVAAGSLVPNLAQGRPARAGSPPPVEYSYDAAGRLTGVADTKANQAATYHYDAAGNITSITRGTAVTLPAGRPDGLARGQASPRIVNVTSAGNPITNATAGTTVTINGSGFDPVVGHNVVRFGGTVAQVESATSTELTVFVPPMAGAGHVSVVTAGGAAVSSWDFFIPPSPYTSAQVGSTAVLSPGQAHSIGVPTSGKIALLALPIQANPRAGLANPERLSLNFTASTLGSYSVYLYDPHNQLLAGPRGFGGSTGGFAVNVQQSGTYTVLVDPGNSTGNLQLTATPFQDVQASIKTSNSASAIPLKVTTTVPGQGAYFAFTGTAGQHVSAVITNATLQGAGWGIESADGDQLLSTNGIGGTAFSGRATLPVSGQYYVYVNSQFPSIGTFDLNVYEFSDVTGSVAESTSPAAPPTNASMALPGQNGSLSFQGVAGQSVDVLLSGSTVGNYQASLIAPDHTVLESTTCGAGACFLDRLTLAESGRYTITLAPNSGETGQIGVAVYRVADVKVALTPASRAPGTATTVTTQLPGQDAYVTFHAAQGMHLSVSLANGTIQGYTATLLAPNGDQLAGNGFGPGSGYLDRVDVQQTGTYTLYLQHHSSFTGSVSVTVYDGSDFSESITPSTTLAGSSKSFTISFPGQNGVLSFSGRAGEAVSADFADATMGYDAAFETASGRVLESNGFGGGSGFLDRTQLPSTGSYRLAISHSNSAVGTASVTLYKLTDVRGSITPNGASVPVNLALPGDNAAFTFNGVINHAVTLNVNSTTLPGYFAAIYSPDGSQLAAGGFGVGQGSLVNVALPENGTYTIAVTHQGPNVGSAQLSLTEIAVEQAQPRRPHLVSANRSEKRLFHTGASTVSHVAPARSPRAQVAKSQARGLLIGAVRDDNGTPLAGVAVTIGSHRTVTSRWGDFTLPAVSAGAHVLLVDGHGADRRGISYGLFQIAVDVRPKHVNSLPYVIWMPRLDTKHEVTIPSPTHGPVTLTTQRIPGLRVILPAGAVVRDLHGHVVHRLGITPIPTARPPFPFPAGHPFPVYFTVQPGGAVVTPARVEVIYPNVDHMPPGSRIPFWSYDANHGGWWKYGYGTVSADGKSIVPDFGTYFSSFSGAGAPSDKGPPPHGPHCGTCPCPAGGGGGGGSGDGPGPGGPGYPGIGSCGDPIDMQTGLDVVSQTDLSIPDVMPLNITRTYRTDDPNNRWFGQGESFTYGIYLYSVTRWQQVSLVLPGGGQILFNRVSPGNDQYSAVYASTDSPGLFFGAKLRWGAFGGWSLYLANGDIYQFTDFGWSGNNAVLTAIVDRNGNETSLSWDPSAHTITGIRSPNGYWVQLSYAGERVSQIQDDAGRTVTYSYTSGQLASVTEPDGATTTYSYTPHGNLTTITDARGNTFETNSYDSNGRVTQQTQADGGVYRISYQTDAGDNVTGTTVTYPNGSIRKTTFDAAGYPTADSLASGTSLQQSYTFVRQPGTDQILSETDALRRKTAFTYDAQGNVTSVMRLAGTPGAQTYRYTYNQFSEPTSVTDPLGHATTDTYDARGNLISATDPLGRRSTFTYDAEGEVTSATDPLGHTIRLGYTFGVLSSGTDALGQTSTQLTDSAGHVVTSTDPLGDTITRTYDANGNLTSVTDPLGHRTSQAYDGDNKVVSITDPRRGTTYNTYDSMDRLCATSDPLAGLAAPLKSCPTAATAHTTVYMHDSSGNVVRMIDRRGQATTYSYDLLDRLTQTKYADGSTVADTYDDGNRLLKLIDSKTGTITNAYDGLDRLTSQTDPVGLHNVSCNGHSVTVCYSYDGAGNRTGMVVTGQQPISYAYDAADALIGETQGSGSVTCGSGKVSVCLTYNGDGLRASVTLPDGVSQQYGYDAANQLMDISYGRGSGTKSCGSFAVGSCLGFLTYGYDNAGRRISVSGPWARTSLPTAVASPTYNAGNELTKWGGSSLSYDTDGNLVKQGSTSYTWNARDQLAGIAGGSPGAFGYDALGRRISATLSGQTSQYVYDGLNPVQRLRSGNPVADMLDGPSLNQTFAVTSGGTTSSVLTDAIGSTVALAEGTGGVSTSYTYGPFGATTTTGAANGNTAGFAGMQNDGSTALYFDNARYYSPVQSRFVSQDPIGFGGGTADLYQYANDMPTMRTDPSGLGPGGGGYGGAEPTPGLIIIVAIIGVIIYAVWQITHPDSGCPSSGPPTGPMA